MGKMESLKKNVIYSVLYQVLVLIFPLITSPYIARVLGATQIGNFSYVNTIANYFVLFAMLGVNNYGNRNIARARENRVELDRVFSEFINEQRYKEDCILFRRKLIEYRKSKRHKSCIDVKRKLAASIIIARPNLMPGFYSIIKR